MWSAFSTVLTVLFTGLVANRLLQGWQYRSWIKQQRFLGSEKKYEALKAHADEVSRVAGRRHAAMNRLVGSLNQSSEALDERLKIYSDALDEWNQRINEFYFKTTMYMNFRMTRRLENDINARFYAIGQRLETAIRNKRAAIDIDKAYRQQLFADLSSLQGQLGLFNRDMLRIVMNSHSAIYHGTLLRYTENDLEYIPTWNLIKALFITRIDTFGVTLTSFELEPPALRKP